MTVANRLAFLLPASSQRSIKPYSSVFARLIALASMALMLAACEPSVDMEIREPIRPVRTVIAEVGQGYMLRSYYGAVQADLISKLSFRVGGVIDSIEVEIGQQVAKGQMIATINNNDLELKLDQEKAALLQAKAEAVNAKVQYERSYGLVEKGVVSQNEYESTETAYRTSRAALEQARKSVQLAEKQLGYANLKVPVRDCTVSELAAEVGENVSSGQVVATLNCGDHFEVLTNVSENVIRDISVGDNVIVRLNVYQGEDYQGIVSEVGAAVGNRSTYPVVIRITTPDDRLRVGMAAEVSLRVSMEQLTGQIVVPFSAVGEDSIGRYVYVFEALDADLQTSEQDTLGVARRVAVTLGQVTNEGISISSGVNAGDRVITAGLRYLTDGRKVKLFSYDVETESSAGADNRFDAPDNIKAIDNSAINDSVTNDTTINSKAISINAERG